MGKILDIILSVVVGVVIGTIIILAIVEYNGKQAESCEDQLHQLSVVYCQALEVLKRSGSTNRYVLELIKEEEENPVCADFYSL